MNTNKKWTKEEEDFIKYNYKNMNDKEMSIHLLRTAHSVKNKRLSLNLTDFFKAPIQAGEKFGRLTVIGKSDKKGSDLYLMCLCECGEIKEIRDSSIRYGNSSSCGCYRVDRTKEANRLEPKEGSYNWIEASYKHGAKRRGIHYELVIQDIKNLISQNCYWCGIGPRLWNPRFSRDGKRTKNDECTTIEWAEQQWIYANGIDRLNNDHSVGYTVENCVPCCTDCNRMRMDRTPENFLSQIESISLHQKSKNKH